MTSRDFCYWLQGFFEVAPIEVESLDETQVKTIRRHLNMVFAHEIDPSFPDVEKLRKIHEDDDEGGGMPGQITC